MQPHCLWTAAVIEAALLASAEEELKAAQADLDGLEITDAAFGAAEARAILAQAKADAAS